MHMQAVDRFYEYQIRRKTVKGWSYPSIKRWNRKFDQNIYSIGSEPLAFSFKEKAPRRKYEIWLHSSLKKENVISLKEERKNWRNGVNTGLFSPPLLLLLHSSSGEQGLNIEVVQCLRSYSLLILFVFFCTLDNNSGLNLLWQFFVNLIIDEPSPIGGSTPLLCSGFKFWCRTRLIKGSFLSLSFMLLCFFHGCCLTIIKITQLLLPINYEINTRCRTWT